jgi:hypothetical protein
VTKCSGSSQCVNTIGSYKCECKEGFLKLNNYCIDIDECNEWNNINCSINSECVNYAGSYECKCFNGFRRLNGECRGNYRKKLAQDFYLFS